MKREEEGGGVADVSPGAHAELHNSRNGRSVHGIIAPNSRRGSLDCSASSLCEAYAALSSDEGA